MRDCNFEVWKVRGELGALLEFTQYQGLFPEEGVRANV